MGLFNRTQQTDPLAEKLSQLSDEQRTRLLEATSSPTTEDWFWGRINTSGAEEDFYWRRLSDNWAHKDVLPSTYLDIHNQCFEAYNANPMANAIIETGVNFVMGDGVQIDAKHPKVQILLDSFWNDTDNHMALRQFDLATELALYGELFVRIFVNQYSGAVKIAQIDPILIDDIVCDPDNIERQLRVHRRATSVTGTTDVLQSPTDPGMIGHWFSVPDEVLHFTINKVTNAKRGKSDLATLLPWLRRYKDWLIDRVRINKYKSAFLWDITLTGADRRTIDEKMMALARPPEPGSVVVHSESEKWTAVQPNISADDVASDGQAIKIMVAMGAGIPPHYLAEGGDVNRATAAEMGLPVLKKYQRRQDYLNHLISSLLQRSIDEAVRAGSLPRTVDKSFTVRFPQLESTAAEAQGIAALRMAQALQVARGLGIITTATASQLFFDACREEVDVQKELSNMDPLVPNEVPKPATTSDVGADSDRATQPSAPSLLNAHYHGKTG